MGRALNRLAALALAAASVCIATSGALAAGDAASGANLFKRCMVCHTADKGGPNRVGPNLFGVVGRKAGSLASYSYSRAMAASGIIWSEANLAPYLTSPSTVVPGTKMTFAGLSQPQQAQDVATYLGTLK